MWRRARIRAVAVASFATNLASLATSLVPGVAGAEVTPSADTVCFDAASSGQRARNEGRLLEAKASFIRCGAATCDAKVVARCVAWLEGAEAAIPSIVIHAKDGAGRDVPEGELAVDGRPADRFTNGMALELDPGRHELRFRAQGMVVVETIVLHEREKARSVDFVFRTEPPPAFAIEPSRGAGRVPVAAWIFGGSAIVLGGAATYLGLTALDDRSTLGCATSCAQADADSISTRFLVADILGLTAIVAAGVAGWLILSRPVDRTDQRALR